MTFVDPQQCPLCGQGNQCGIAAGKGTCWCFCRPIPQNLIYRLPPKRRDQACICETCASGRRDSTETLERMKKLLKLR